jgi:hypothetical protein
MHCMSHADKHVPATFGSNMMPFAYAARYHVGPSFRQRWTRGARHEMCFKQIATQYVCQILQLIDERTAYSVCMVAPATKQNAHTGTSFENQSGPTSTKQGSMMLLSHRNTAAQTNKPQRNCAED